MIEECNQGFVGWENAKEKGEFKDAQSIIPQIPFTITI